MMREEVAVDSMREPGLLTCPWCGQEPSERELEDWLGRPYASVACECIWCEVNPRACAATMELARAKWNARKGMEA